MNDTINELQCQVALDNVFSTYNIDKKIALKLGIKPTFADLYEYLVNGNEIPHSVKESFWVSEEYESEDLVRALQLEFERVEDAFSTFTNCFHLFMLSGELKREWSISDYIYELQCRVALDNVFSEYYINEENSSMLGLKPTHTDLYDFLAKGNSFPDSVYPDFWICEQHENDDLVSALELEFDRAGYAFKVLIKELYSHI